MFDSLAQKFSSIVSKITGKSRLTEKNIQDVVQDIKVALLEADVPYELVEQFIGDVKSEVLGKKIVASLKPAEQFTSIVHERLKDFLGAKKSVPFSFQIPSVVMVMGLQGSGKTTTLAKLAHHIQMQAKKRGKKRRILMASVDFYRPAAVDQLEILAQQVGVAFYRTHEVDPIKDAQAAYKYYQQEGFEFLLLDTAGRLHVDNAMIQELKKIDDLLSPKHKLLVLDSMTGQESLNVAKAFEQAVGFHAAILTKMDSDTRSGAAFSFRYAMKKQIAFVGVGEKIVDIELFYPDRMVDKILGMGDMLSLVEKANEKIKESDQEKITRAFERGNMTLQDFADQLSMVGKLGSLSSLMKYLPGASGMNIDSAMLEKGEVELKKFMAIIRSMTQKERLCPRLLDASRKQRIAKGAGVGVDLVNLLLKRFEESQQYVKLLKKMKRRGRFF